MFIKKNRIGFHYRFHPYRKLSVSNLYNNENKCKTEKLNLCRDKGNEETLHIDGGKLLVEGWKEADASASEAIVKAERYCVDQTFEQMQKESVDHIHQQKQKITVKTERKS